MHFPRRSLLLAPLAAPALASAISSAGIARFKPSLPIRVGKDGMLVLLGKREADGTVIVVGSSNDRDLLASTALHATNYTLATSHSVIASNGKSV